MRKSTSLNRSMATAPCRVKLQRALASNGKAPEYRALSLLLQATFYGLAMILCKRIGLISPIGWPPRLKTKALTLFSLLLCKPELPGTRLPGWDAAGGRAPWHRSTPGAARAPRADSAPPTPPAPPPGPPRCCARCAEPLRAAPTPARSQSALNIEALRHWTGSIPMQSAV